MAEKVVSPGVFTNEIDQTFLPAAVGDIGAALIGPTVKGPPLIPTIVNSYSEFEQMFGSTFKSGSNSFSYLTSLTAREYLKSQGYMGGKKDKEEKSLQQKAIEASNRRSEIPTMDWQYDEPEDKSQLNADDEEPNNNSY